MNFALALKSEIMFGLQLVTRHRAPRLAGLLAASVTVLLLTGGASEAALPARQRALLWLAGILAGVAGSRLLSHGGPLAAARRVASPWLLVPAGRLLGFVTVAGPLFGATSGILIGSRWGIGPAGLTAVAMIVQAAATAALVMALSPAIGASGAAGLGLVAAFFGGLAPSSIAAALATWPVARGPAVMLWNTLPLPWRALRWLAEGTGSDPAFLALWVLAGLAASAWTIERFAEHGSAPGGSA
ncbi:MAG: hypothetical protein HY560_02980 [Gemmatimonadetes bacterium]|nr:hypothetical protein [Gemmatimonadota bacterium]